MKINIETQMVEVQTDEVPFPFLASVNPDAEGWRKLSIKNLLLAICEHWYYKNIIPIKSEIILSEPLTSAQLQTIYEGTKEASDRECELA